MKPYALPLQTLLELLDARGLTPDLPAQVRLQAMLEARGGKLLARASEEDVRELAMLLAPVVAKNPAEQELFHQVFGEYWQRFVLPEAERLKKWLESPESTQVGNNGVSNTGENVPKKPKHWPLWAKMLLAMLLPLGAIAAYLFWPEPPKPITPDPIIPSKEICQPPQIQGIDFSLDSATRGLPTQFTARTQPISDSLWMLWQLDEQAPQLGKTAVFQLEKGKSHTVLLRVLKKRELYDALNKLPESVEKDVLMSLAFPKQMPNASQLAQLRRQLPDSLCLKAAYSQSVQTTLPMANFSPEKMAEDTRGLPFFTSKTWALLAFGCALIWLLAEVAVFTSRRQKQNAPPLLQHSDYAPLELPFPNRENQLKEGMGELATAMRQRQRGERQFLDVMVSIRATVAAGGMPQVRFKFNTQPTEYLMIIEATEAHGFQTLAFRALANFLKKQEVLLDVYTWRNGRAYSAKFPHGTSLAQLYTRHPQHRLMLMGDGHSLMNVRRPQLEAGMEKTLRRWTDRLLLTPAPMADWGYREEALAKTFQVMPHTWAGAVQGVQLLQNETGISHKRVREQAEKLDKLPSAANVDWHSAQALRLFLGENAFLALCMAQVYAKPRWEIALAMLGSLGGAWSDAFLLARVPWLQTGDMPVALRLALLQNLAPEQERQAREVLLELLEEAGESLPQDAFARQEWEEQHGLNAFLLDPNDPDKAARAYQLWQEGRPADTPQKLHLSQLANLLPQTAPKFFYKNFAPLRWEHAAMRLAAACLISVGAWNALQPKNGTEQLAQWDAQSALQPKNLVQYTTQADSLARLNNGFIAMFDYLEKGNSQGNSKSMDADLPQQGVPQTDPYALYKQADEKFTADLNRILPDYAAQTARLDTVRYNQQLLQYLWGKDLYGKKLWAQAAARLAYVQHPRLRDEALHARGLCAFYQNDLATARALADSLPLAFWDTHKPNLLDLLPQADPQAEAKFRQLYAPQMAKIWLAMQKNAEFLTRKQRTCPEYRLTKTDTTSRYFDMDGQPQLRLTATYTYVTECEKKGAWETSIRLTATLQANGKYVVETPAVLSDRQTREAEGVTPVRGGEEDLVKKDTVGNGQVVQQQPVKEEIPEPEMVFVKGGTFTMGCTDEQGSDCLDAEKPAHQVTLSDYYIGKYEVTQAQWKEIMGSNPSSFNNCDQCPVESVSWNEVQDFIKKLNARTGKNYRLPTEAEWEFAARGGTKTKGYKYAGSNNIDDVAWYDENSQSTTHAVGGKKPNELGIYDMSGNVSELCEDDWHDNYNGAPNDAKAWIDSPMARFHVRRGGSRGNLARDCRVAIRGNFSPSFRNPYLGFRLALGS